MSERKRHRLTAKRWEQEVPVTLVTEVGKEEFRKLAVLPFLPRIGDNLAVGPDKDYMEVEHVFWCPEEGIGIWLEAFTRGSNMDPPALRRILEGDGWLEWEEFKARVLARA